MRSYRVSLRSMVGTWCRAREVATASHSGSGASNERRRTRAGSKSLDPDARPGQHLRIYVDSFNGTDAFMSQHRFGQGARSRAEVKHPGWAGTGDFVCGPGQSFFVAWDELGDGIVVGGYRPDCCKNTT